MMNAVVFTWLIVSRYESIGILVALMLLVWHFVMLVLTL